MAKEDYYEQEDDEVTFNILNQDVVDRLIRDGDIVVPKKKIDVPKDQRWNKKQMTSKILQGIQNGDSVQQMSQAMTSVIGNNINSAIRNTRTMTTSAENHGRLDSYKNLSDQGVVMKKEWEATPDDRTRPSHVDIDGEEQDIDKPFSNGCMFPGDGRGPAEEVWMCRCAMGSHIIGFQKKDGSISYVNYEPDETMHERQMEEEKARRSDIERPAERPMPEKAPVEKFIRYIDEYNMLKTDIIDAKVKYNEVSELSQDLTEKEIIEKLAGGDMTKGSCASLGLSYCANKAGLDVTDFRGGSSQDVFSQNSSINRMLKLANANIQEFKVQKESKDVAEIIKNIELNKEFLLSTGKHIAIIKRTQEEGLQYLEMQSSTSNGWKPFAYTIESKWGTNKVTVAETLQKRFGCRKTVDSMKIGDRKLVFEKKVTLADVDSFKKTDDFKEMLGYINTSTDNQKKGASGFEK